MLHDGPGFEEHEAIFLKNRHLPERLQRAIVRFVLIALFEEAGLVRQTGFLQRPARAQIAHLALGKLWHPFESGDRDHALCSFAMFVRRRKLVESFAPADHMAVATLGSAADAWSRRAPFDYKKMAFQLVERSGPAFLVAAATLLVVQARMCECEFGSLGNGAKPDLDKRLAGIFGAARPAPTHTQALGLHDFEIFPAALMLASIE